MQGQDVWGGEFNLSLQNIRKGDRRDGGPYVSEALWCSSCVLSCTGNDPSLMRCLKALQFKLN